MALIVGCWSFLPSSRPRSHRPMSGFGWEGATSGPRSNRSRPSTDSYARVLGEGAFELSKEVVANRVAVIGKLFGSLGTGANPGTLLGSGSTLGGGADIGIAVAFPLEGAGQAALIGRVIQRNGTSLVVERALTALPENPINQKVVDVAEFLGSAAGKIAVPYRESGARLDVAWAYITMSGLSVQAAIGAEHRHRYYRSTVPSAVFNYRQTIVPRFGLALGLDGSSPKCGDHCVPIALLLEYELSPTHLWVSVPGPEGTLGTAYSRFVDHVAAIGLHYASDRHADLDAALTAYMRFNAPPELTLDVGSGLVPPRTMEIGGQAMARYFW